MAKLKSVSTFIDEDLKEALELICKEEGCSIYSKIAELIEDYVNSKIKQRKPKEKENGKEEDW